MPEGPDSRIVITSPAALHGELTEALLTFDNPEQFVAACFFRREEGRQTFLERLRAVAGAMPPAGQQPEQIDADVRGKLTAAAHSKQQHAAMEQSIRWWTHVRKQSYHVYRLRIGLEPYSTSCIISFTELTPEIVRLQIDDALLRLQSERSRLLDAFGLVQAD